MREAKHRGAQAVKTLTINDRGPSLLQAQTPSALNPTMIMLNPERCCSSKAPSAWPLLLLAQSRGALAPLDAEVAVRHSALQTNLWLFAAPSERSHRSPRAAGCP